MPTPESRPHYYVRHGLWRLRAARRVAPWLLLALPVAVIAVAAFEGKTIWHDTFHRHSKPSAAQSERGTLKPRPSSRASKNSANSSSASSSGVAGSSSSSASGARSVSLAVSPLLARIHSLRSQIAALLQNGLTATEHVKLWRLRLRLAIAFRKLIRAELAGNLTAAERARLEAQLKKLNERIAILRKINRILRGGVTASEQATLDSLVQQFLQLKAQAPLPSLSGLTAIARVTAGATVTTAPSGGTTTGAVAGVSTRVTATTGASPGNSAFGHSHKKPKKPKKH